MEFISISDISASTKTNLPMDPCLPSINAFKKELLELQQRNAELQSAASSVRSFGEFLDMWISNTGKLYELTLTAMFLFSMFAHLYRYIQTSRAARANATRVNGVSLIELQDGNQASII